MKRKISRRCFIETSAMTLASVTMLGCATTQGKKQVSRLDTRYWAGYPKSIKIRSIRWLGEPIRTMRSNGDVWTCTWADDDCLYAVSDDTTGVGNVCNSNLAIYRIEGTPPGHKVITINPMSEYGRIGQHEGLDTWKGNGMVCVDKVLYLAVSQHSGAGDFSDNVQRVYDASIVKSTDHGKTWSPKPPVGKAMFPGTRFSTPFFVQYGRDYDGAMDEYVYAVSNVGTWNNGNYMVLGRVRRDKIADLNAGDWEFFGGADAQDVPSWSKDFGKAHAIFRHRGFTSMTGIQYVPAAERFILPQWAYTDLDGNSPWGQTMLCIYESDKPWGPWRHVYTEPNWGNALYNPGLPSKWFDDGGKRMWMTQSGDFANLYRPRSYCFMVQKLELVL